MVEGQISMFQLNDDVMKDVAGQGTLPNVADFQKAAKMAMEKEMLGLYLGEHPLEDRRYIIDKVSNITTEDIVHFEDNPWVKDNMEVLMVAIINRKKTQITKTGKMMAFVEVEDLVGTAETIVFPNVFDRSSDILYEDSMVVVRGRLNFKDEETPKIIAEKITPISVAEEFYRRKEIV
jgi:DNA polymerase-3 subunit alpha